MTADPGAGSSTSSSSGRPARRKVVAVGGGVLVVVVALLGWRWQRDRASIGTDVAAELTMGRCGNAIGWTDPDTGVGWDAGHDPVTTGAYESEPRRLEPGPVTPTVGVPMRWISRHSVGTVHFHTYDHATFTSRTGGTIELHRPQGAQIVTADCTAFPGDVWEPGPEHYAVALPGVLGHASGDPDQASVLAPGSIRLVQDGVVKAETSTVTGEFALYSPVLGTFTIEGDLGDGTCASYTMTVTSGVPDPIDLLC